MPERLSAVCEYPGDALFGEPAHSWERLGDEGLGEFGVGESLGDAHEVFVEGVLGIGADVYAGLFLLGHFG